MAIQISGTDVINNSRVLTNIEAFNGLVKSIYNYVFAASGNNNLVNRGFLFVPSNNSIINLPTLSVAPGNQCVLAITNATGVVVDPSASFRIQGLPLGETLTLDIPNVTLTFTYVDATRGWIIT